GVDAAAGLALAEEDGAGLDLAHDADRFLDHLVRARALGEPWLVADDLLPELPRAGVARVEREPAPERGDGLRAQARGEVDLDGVEQRLDRLRGIAGLLREAGQLQPDLGILRVLIARGAAVGEATREARSECSQPDLPPTAKLFSQILMPRHAARK